MYGICAISQCGDIEIMRCCGTSDVDVLTHYCVESWRSEAQMEKSATDEESDDETRWENETRTLGVFVSP